MMVSPRKSSASLTLSPVVFLTVKVIGPAGTVAGDGWQPSFVSVMVTAAAPGNDLAALEVPPPHAARPAAAAEAAAPTAARAPRRRRVARHAARRGAAARPAAPTAARDQRDRCMAVNSFRAGRG